MQIPTQHACLAHCLWVWLLAALWGLGWGWPYAACFSARACYVRRTNQAGTQACVCYACVRRHVELKWEHLEPILHTHVKLKSNKTAYARMHQDSQANFQVRGEVALQPCQAICTAARPRPAQPGALAAGLPSALKGARLRQHAPGAACPVGAEVARCKEHAFLLAGACAGVRVHMHACTNTHACAWRVLQVAAGGRFMVDPEHMWKQKPKST